MPSAEGALQDGNWDRLHGMDARYRVPWIGGPVYIRVMVGRDRRPKTRTQADTAASIRRSLLNVILFALGACVLYTGVAAAVLLMSAVLQ